MKTKSPFVVLMMLLAVLAACSTHASSPAPAPAPSPEAHDATTTRTVASPLVTCPTPAQLDTDLTAAAQSDVISLSGVNPISCPEVAMTETWTGGTLVFSDSPETPTAKAKLYEDPSLAATSGSTYNRVYAYHVNGKASGNMRFTVLLKNTSASSGTLTVQLKGTAGPTMSFLYGGKLVFSRWLTSTASAGAAVAAGATARLDATFDTTNVAPGNLLAGMWDYSFGQTHKVSICALDQNDSPTGVCPGLAVAARDASHQRGTFPYADKIYDTASGVVIDTADGIQQLPLAGNTTNDTNAVGTDATDATAQTLSGNYGVLYRTHLSAISSDGQNLGFLLNPRGGQWGGAVWASAGLLAGGKFLIPSASGSTGDNTKAAVEGRYAPGDAGASPWLQISPTGGSALPLRLVVVPH